MADIVKLRCNDVKCYWPHPTLTCTVSSWKPKSCSAQFVALLFRSPGPRCVGSCARALDALDISLICFNVSVVHCRSSFIEGTAPTRMLLAGMHAIKHCFVRRAASSHVIWPANEAGGSHNLSSTSITCMPLQTLIVRVFSPNAPNCRAQCALNCDDPVPHFRVVLNIVATHDLDLHRCRIQFVFTLESCC